MPVAAPDVRPGSKGGRSILQALDRTAQAVTLQSLKMTAGPDGKASGTLTTKDRTVPLHTSAEAATVVVLCSGQTMQSSSSYRHLDTLGACHDYHISGYTQRKCLFTARKLRAGPSTEKAPVCRFSLAQGLGPGVRLCSDYFEVAGQLWRVEVYPAGKVTLSLQLSFETSLVVPACWHVSSAASCHTVHGVMTFVKSCCSKMWHTPQGCIGPNHIISPLIF